MKKVIIFTDPITGKHTVLKKYKTTMKVKHYDEWSNKYIKTKKVITKLQETENYIYITIDKERDDNGN